MNGSIWLKLESSLTHQIEVKERNNKPLWPPSPNIIGLISLRYIPSKTDAIFLPEELEVRSLMAAFSARHSYYTIDHSSSLLMEICQEKQRLFVAFIDLFLASDSMDTKRMCYE